MNSAVINKLIRSEMWPLLRAQGFTQFEGRSARRYAQWRVDVVNFQSFNSYIAAAVGCTTYSFIVNLGVFVRGSAQERWMRRHKLWGALPEEHHCDFRASLVKRSAVDGFEREDIFLIDESGSTTAAVFQEVRSLLAEPAVRWFRQFDDVEFAIELVTTGAPGTADELHGVGRTSAPARACFVGESLLARLHRTRTFEDTGALLRATENTIGAYLDFQPALRSGPLTEQKVLDILGDGGGVGTVWGALETPFAGGNTQDWRACVHEQLWPRLRQAGFGDFAQRKARRDAEGVRQIVELVPIEKAAARRSQLPEGLFYVRIGLYWVGLVEEPVAKPDFMQCRVDLWLPPPAAAASLARLAFTNLDDVVTSFEQSGLAWLALLTAPAAALRFLSEPDLAIFRAFPTMGGIGGRGSTRRLLLLAELARLAGDVTARKVFLDQAEGAVSLAWERLRPNLLSEVAMQRRRCV